MSDDFCAKDGKPWILSDGMTGKQFHMSYEWISRKKNSRESEIGMTTFRFAQTCGKCHPGGGLMELDRNGKRYDSYQTSNPEIASSFDGDYYKAAWDKSGVLEVDCLICHKPDYSAEARNTQLDSGNLGWAATAGAGFATVTGSVNTGETPGVVYDTAAFENGRVKINISRPTDRNCLFCHGEAEVKKRGHVWDGRNADIHTAAGLKCVTCHTAGLDHQILKGRSSEVTVRDDLDSDKLSCASCHDEGRLGARKPSHAKIPSDHISKIACVTCHIRETNATAVLAVDTTTGKTVGLATNRQAKKYGESLAWTPAYFRLRDGKIYSGNALLPVWWGNRVGSVVHPLTLAETGRAYERAKDHIRDDDGDGKLEANTKAEIGAMLQAVGEILKGGRFDQNSPAYVKGNKVWELSSGKLIAKDHPQAAPLRWTFSHNVSPAKQAWGANGCADCHVENSKFFNSLVVVDPYDLNGKQVTVPMWRYTRLDKSVIKAK